VDCGGAKEEAYRQGSQSNNKIQRIIQIPYGYNVKESLWFQQIITSLTHLGKPNRQAQYWHQLLGFLA
jgi:hypothetical protein